MIYLYEVPQKRGGGDKNEKKKQTADMYLIYTHKLSNNTAEITAHPHLKYRICEKVFWSHWDSKRELLYILEPKKAEKEVCPACTKANLVLLLIYAIYTVGQRYIEWAQKYVPFNMLSLPRQKAECVGKVCYRYSIRFALD
jgi:hypothetical protein